MAQVVPVSVFWAAFIAGIADMSKPSVAGVTMIEIVARCCTINFAPLLHAEGSRTRELGWYAPPLLG